MKRVRIRFQKVPILEDSEAWFGRAHIVVGSHSVDPYDDAILLSSDCRSAGEIGSEADRIIRELQDIKKKARTLDWRGLKGAERPKK